MDHRARLLTSPQQPAGPARLSAKITPHNLRAAGGQTCSYLAAVPLTGLQRTGAPGRVHGLLPGSTSSRRTRAAGKKAGREGCHQRRELAWPTGLRQKAALPAGQDSVRAAKVTAVLMLPQRELVRITSPGLP